MGSAGPAPDPADALLTKYHTSAAAATISTIRRTILNTLHGRSPVTFLTARIPPASMITVSVLRPDRPRRPVASSGEDCHVHSARPPDNVAPLARLRGLLIGAQVAISFVLLSGAGLFLRTYQQMVKLDPGFESRQVLASLMLTKGPGPARRCRRYC